MARQLTRGETWDELRIMLQVRPPIDQVAGTALWGPAGKQPDYAPVPSNRMLEMALNDALADINTDAGFHSNIISIDVPAYAATFTGPIKIKLESFTTTPVTDPEETTNLTDIFTTLGANNINSVRSANWIDSPSGSPNLPLIAAPRRISNREDEWIDVIPANVPQYYYLDGVSLYLYPAPVNGGTLVLWVGTGLIAPQSDTDIIDQLPADYQVGVRFMTLVELAKYMTMNVEMQQRAQNFTPNALMWRERIKAWYNYGVSQQEQSSLGLVTNRGNYGTRRRRR